MQLPAFSLKSSLDQTVTPASLKGRAFLFYFINLDCPCCMEANPSFRQLNQAFPGGVIGVADGSIEKVKRWVKANEPGYEVLADEKQVLAKAFKAINAELAGDRAMLMRALNPMLTARRALAVEYANLQKVAMDFARDDEVCRRLMTVPGVGPIVALTYRATIDVPSRFRRSKSVGAHLGLTPRAYQSGEVDWTGRVSKSGDAMARAALYEAAHILLVRVKRWSSLKAWGMRLVKNRGHKRAVTALARRMAVLMHRIWVEGTTFLWKTGDGQAIGQKPIPAV